MSFKNTNKKKKRKRKNKFKRNTGGEVEGARDGRRPRDPAAPPGSGRAPPITSYVYIYIYIYIYIVLLHDYYCCIYAIVTALFVLLLLLLLSLLSLLSLL